jgi:hypothetical protein
MRNVSAWYYSNMTDHGRSRALKLLINRPYSTKKW